MTNKRVAVVVGILAMCTLGFGSAFAGDNNKIKGKGVITAHTGDVVTVETSETTVTLNLTGDTKVEYPIGLGARKRQVGPEVLIPGLKIGFEGEGTDLDKATATKISFDKDDLTLAKVIQAGLNPVAQQQAINIKNISTNQHATVANQQAAAANQQAIDFNSLVLAAAMAQVQENNDMIADNAANLDAVAQATAQRFSELGQYSVKAQATVYFGIGDYSLAPDYKESLAGLAKKALANQDKSYLIQVSGYADSSGNLADNQTLSKHRAEAVTAYLIQYCSVPVGRIVAPGAMSDTNTAASNETSSGRAENRRAEVKLLINKGIAGGE